MQHALRLATSSQFESRPDHFFRSRLKNEVSHFEALQENYPTLGTPLLGSSIVLSTDWNAKHRPRASIGSSGGADEFGRCASNFSSMGR